MIPYATFTYFGVLLYPVLPMLLLGLLGRSTWLWVLLVTIAMLFVQNAGVVTVGPGVAINELALVGGYLAYQGLVAGGLLWIRHYQKARAAFWVALLLCLLPLAAAKLVPVLTPGSAFGFLGISYVSFRALDVLISIHDGLVTRLSLSSYFGYLFFFATASSGPIDRYRRFLGDWQRSRTRTEFVQDLDNAVHRIFTGFLYKFLIGALIERYWLGPAAQSSEPLAIASYMYAYSLHLFFDFAGYSMFAIGVSYLFGIHTPENFNRPFLARDIRDFWNRWHISLSHFFRDHIYSRFVMAATRGRWFKSRYTGSYLGFLLTFLLMGLWHGLELRYIVYGLYHAALLIATDLVSRANRRHRFWGSGPFHTGLTIVLTFHLVCVGFLIFSGRLGLAR